MVTIVIVTMKLLLPWFCLHVQTCCHGYQNNKLLIEQYSNKYTLNTYCYYSNTSCCYDVFLYELNKMQ